MALKGTPHEINEEEVKEDMEPQSTKSNIHDGKKRAIVDGTGRFIRKEYQLTFQKKQLSH